MHKTYEDNRRFADGLGPQLTQIIVSNLGVIASVVQAADVTDKRAGADYRVTLSGGSDVLVRVRRYATYKDFTVRSYSSGQRTELEKLRSGYGDWYVYAWTNDGGLEDWMLVDLSRMRRAGLLDREWKEIENKDHETRFIVIPRGWLRSADCIASEKNPPPQHIDCGYGKHDWHDAIENKRKKKVCKKCGRFWGYYASVDDPEFPNHSIIG